ncbi:hypothetical protein ACI1TM_08625 [Lactococcus garvieae]|uniref:hypothetical protein n=1 Tax=Lactococcus garvieae TaxID=1363 RepID=UPI0038551D9C
MSKLEELEKRKARLEVELQRSKASLEKQMKTVKKKEQEFKQLEADLVTALLSENGLSFNDLRDLLGQDEKHKSDNVSSRDDVEGDFE